LDGLVVDVKDTAKSPSGGKAGLTVKVFDNGEFPGEPPGLDSRIQYRLQMQLIGFVPISIMGKPE
jgi:hypothetical protein